MTLTDRTRLLRSLFVALALLLVGPLAGTSGGLFGAAAAQAQTVQRIDVSGNVRTEDSTVISYLSIRVGDAATSDRISQSIDSLLASRLFRSVDVTYGSGVLRVTVTENPIVAAVLFEGNDRFTDEQLLAMVGTGTRGVFTDEQLEADVAAIENAHDSAGFTSAQVTARTEVLENARVRVVFVITEGDKAGIAAINFTGNTAFNANQLKSFMQTKESHLLSWLFSDDTYDPDKLEGDKEAIRIAYANAGYPDARVLSAVAEYDAGENAYYISIAISEGERYSFGAIGIETSITNLDTRQLEGAVRTYQGDRYSFRDLQRTVEDMALRALSQGFPFADVRPRIDRDVANRTFNITYLVDEGPRVYVDRINIFGNVRTRDFVIRRAFEFSEGDPFNRNLVSRGRSELLALDLFSSVDITTEPGSGRDRVIINVAVVEKSTGEYGATVGWSSTEGVLGEVSLTERNFLGRNQYLRLSIGASQSGRTFQFAFTEPRFMGLRISAGIRGERAVTNESATSFFGSQRTGGMLVFGLPVTDEISVDVFAGGYQTVFTDVTAPFSGVVTNGQVMNKAVVGYTLNYNTLDDARNPTEGLIARITQQYAGISHSFLSTEAAARYFVPVADTGVVFSVKGQAGIINDFSGAGVHPTEAFHKGASLVRGFAPGGFGPRLAANGEPVGYTNYAGLSAELQSPIPGLPDNWGLSVAVFADAAFIGGLPNTFGGAVDPGSVNQPLRSSVGASIIWDSFLGPLRGDIAHVLSGSTSDTTQLFQLTLSNVL